MKNLNALVWFPGQLEIGLNGVLLFENKDVSPLHSMLYTGNLGMRDCAKFSQIRSSYKLEAP